MVILNSGVFCSCKNLVDSLTAMQIWLSSNILQKTSGFGRLISKIDDNSFISAIKCITSHIHWINAIYSTSIVLKYIYVCNLPHHNTGHPAYGITHPVRDMRFYALSASN